MHPQITQISQNKMSSAQRDDPDTYAIIGAAMEVHAQLGHGFLEAVYEQALRVELGLRNIPFATQVQLPVSYKGEQLDCTYRVDFICFDKVIIEIKALSRLTGTDQSQLLNYLKASKFEKGLLINFGADNLQIKRMVKSNKSVKSA